MIITRISPYSGKTNQMDLPITEEQMLTYIRGALVQNAFPNLTAEQREFVKTGYMPEDWAAIFSPGKRRSP